MIFDTKTQSQFPFATKFFEMALTGEESRFAHGFILSGIFNFDLSRKNKE